MIPEVKVAMPLHLTHDMIQAVRGNNLTRCDDMDEMNKRIGWLICAYDVIVRQQTYPVSLRGEAS